MNNAASASLNELIAEHGMELAEDPRRLDAFLRDYCPECRREIFALVAASQAGVPGVLAHPAPGSDLGLSTATLAKHLEEDYGLSSELARWAVNAWSLALGLDVDLDTGPPPVYTKTVGDDPAAQQTAVRRPDSGADEAPGDEHGPALSGGEWTPDTSQPGLSDEAPDAHVHAPAPQRVRKTWVLIAAGVVAFLIALSAGAVYGRSVSHSDGSGTESTSTTLSETLPTSAPSISVLATSSTLASPDAPSSTTTVQAKVSTPSSGATKTGEAAPSTTESTAKLDAAGGDAAQTPTTTTSVLTAAQRLKCTPYGATIEVPRGWSVTELHTEWPGQLTFLAEGPNNCEVRVDSLLEDQNTDLWNDCAIKWENNHKDKYKEDYHRVSMESTVFAGVPAVEWHYSFTTRDGEPSQYRTIYFRPNATGIRAKVATAASEDEKAAAEAIQNSFQFPPQ